MSLEDYIEFETCCLYSLCAVVYLTWITRLDIDVPISVEGLVRTSWVGWRWSMEKCPVKIIVGGLTHSTPVSAFISQLEISGPVPIVRHFIDSFSTCNKNVNMLKASNYRHLILPCPYFRKLPSLFESFRGQHATFSRSLSKKN